MAGVYKVEGVAKNAKNLPLITGKLVNAVGGTCQNRRLQLNPNYFVKVMCRGAHAHIADPAGARASLLKELKFGIM
jgi:hypothetical protein